MVVAPFFNATSISDIIDMSASSCVTKLSALLTSWICSPKSWAQRSSPSLCLFLLFFIMISRPGSTVVRVRLYSVEPPPALLCLSWSLAEIFSYWSKITKVWVLYGRSRFPILAARSATVPVDGHTTWYMSCEASTRTTSGPFGLLSMTQSRWVSTNLFPFLRHPY